ncbi:unnamed protein product [Clavelina lepadiformis]|uniref:Uncharacterized protein n=1 Tax=Clavelina lepadiformis TaxID=159417 RepID=A0ABP0G5D2_CLALP
MIMSVTISFMTGGVTTFLLTWLESLEKRALTLLTLVDFAIAYNLQKCVRSKDILRVGQFGIILKPHDKFRMLHMLDLHDRVINDCEKYLQKPQGPKNPWRAMGRSLGTTTRGLNRIVVEGEEP